ncbi:hypothetical protein [Candidatus Amarobacter glycogenicus]|uniref:hypothetical protein n=1 Tax=Candidatus Amarobacter glycogenicus TaxID=3140699 RepID=UPI002A1367A5|nr:hypothetical protein [Dehalococcoidia bacterium]
MSRVTYNTSGKPLTSAQLQELLPDVDGFIAGLDEIDAAAIMAAPNCASLPGMAWALTT